MVVSVDVWMFAIAVRCSQAAAKLSQMSPGPLIIQLSLGISIFSEDNGRQSDNPYDLHKGRAADTNAHTGVTSRGTLGRTSQKTLGHSKSVFMGGINPKAVE